MKHFANISIRPAMTVSAHESLATRACASGGAEFEAGHRSGATS
jgi:hypothetical protein